MRRLVGVLMIVAGLALAAGTARAAEPSWDAMLVAAECDFDSVRAELRMSGSAPMAGLEPSRGTGDGEPWISGWTLEELYAQAERDFEAVRAELGLSGSAPMVGLERIEGASAARMTASSHP